MTRRNALPLAILAFAVLVRLAAWRVLAPALESDGLAYVTMAQSLVRDGVLTDTFGQHVFYSAGYPLLLAPAFALFGSGMGTVVAVNCLLALIAGLLVRRIAWLVSASEGAANLALGLWAVWLPALWNATLPAKENLSTPLLLGVLLAALAIARGGRLVPAALAGGLCWGAGVLTGGSSLFTGGALAVALGARWLAGERAAAAKALLPMALGALLVLGPWLVASARMVGEPMLNSNAEFNLYLGNNPAATGTFVSIAETPAGPAWEAQRRALGEAGSAHWLGDKARGWIAGHPVEAARLAMVKLGLFWQPNVPDAADFAASKLVSTVRLGDVALYLLVLAGAVLALARLPMARADRLIFGATIAGFWLIHAVAYVMPRYRDPLAPVLIVLAACWAWPLVRTALSRIPSKGLAHAA